MAQNKCCGLIPFSAIPTRDEAVSLFETSGGNLTRPSTYGADPLSGSPERMARRQNFFDKRFPSLKDIYGSLVNGDASMFKNAVKFYICLCEVLSQ